MSIVSLLAFTVSWSVISAFRNFSLSRSTAEFLATRKRYALRSRIS
jgi:hypothetical protein